MANFQELTGKQIESALAQAVSKQMPIAVTTRSGMGWEKFRSAFLAASGSHLILAMPVDLHGQGQTYQPADRLGLSFKCGHHKHVFSATVVDSAQHLTDDGREIAALKIVSPSKMQRIQRRAFQRVSVPEEALVRAAFWRGGREVEPQGHQDQQAVWTATVADLSAGGLQLICHGYNGPQMEAGDLIGVRLLFGVASETCFVDAQFRYAETDGDKAMMGFQFIGLAHSREGRTALQLISSKVADLQREQGRHDRHRQAS